MSVGKGKGRVPWSKLGKDQLNYIEAKYLPKNLTLKEVHHLCQEEVDGILKHWTYRQAANEVPFTFRTPRPIQQNNRTVEESNADADTVWGWAKKEKRTAKQLLSLGKLPRYMRSNRQTTAWQVISVILLGFEIYILQTQSAADGHRPQQLASSSEANRDQLPPPGSPGPSNEPGEAAEARMQQQTDSGMVSDLIYLIGP